MASKSGSTTNRQDSHIDSTEVRKYLEGASFPADKEDLVAHAKQKQAPNNVVDLLNQLQTPEFGSANDTKMTQYNSLDELIQEIQKIE